MGNLSTPNSVQKLQTALHAKAKAEPCLRDFIRFFGCPIEFNAPRDQLVFSNEALALPLITADPQLLLTLHPICEAAASAPAKTRASLRASVESEVQRLLPQGQANIEMIAKALGLSARTLSRKLAAEGSAFAEIMDQLRHTLALQYLKEPELPLAQTAWLLGYGNSTSFTHAFRRWTGRSPSAVRNEGRAPRNGRSTAAGLGRKEEATAALREAARSSRAQTPTGSSACRAARLRRSRTALNRAPRWRSPGGPFQGFGAIHQGMPAHDRELVLINLLGRQTPVEISADLVVPQ